MEDLLREIPFRITEVSEKEGRKSIQVIRDDKLLFGFGTKLRKLQGFLKFLSTENIKEVVLFGSLHGNYLASFSTVLYVSGIITHVFGYSRNRSLNSANRILIKNHSHNLHSFNSSKEMFQELANFNFLSGFKHKSNSNTYIMPEFGFHSSSMSGLLELWNQLEVCQPSNNKTIILEVGSGLTFLSALIFYARTETIVCGVCVGESKESFVSKIPGLLSGLGFRSDHIAKYMLVDPSGSHTFGKVTKKDILLQKEYHKKTNILFEPIYSLKTWELLSNNAHFISDLPEPWIYLHQGGQLNHLNISEVF